MALQKRAAELNATGQNEAAAIATNAAAMQATEETRSQSRKADRAYENQADSPRKRTGDQTINLHDLPPFPFAQEKQRVLAWFAK